jgi:hypothetical protein
MIVPVSLTKLTREVSKDLEINHNMILSSFFLSGGEGTTFGVPTLYKWSGGNIIINKRFIALLPQTLQIMKMSDSIGNILDEDGNIIIEGASLVKNKRYDVNVDSYTWELVLHGTKSYKCLSNIILSIDKTTDGNEDDESSLPDISTASNGAFLRIDNAVPVWSTVPKAEEATF